jgi:hypothetical protein
MKKTQFYTLLAAGVLGVLSLTGNVPAEERSGAPAATSTAQTRAAPGPTSSTDRMSPELQRAIEAGDAAQTSALMTKLGLSAKPGQPPRHECGTTFCSCSGALGCSTISAACKPDTLSCGDESCSCTKK